MSMPGRLGRIAAWAVLCVGLGLPMVSCATSAPTGSDGLEIVISADGLSAPADFDDIRLEISTQTASGSWNKLWDRDYEVPSVEAPSLPTEFTLLSGQTAEEALIVVTAYSGGAEGTPVVQRVAQVQVPTDRMAVLYMVLAKVCEGQVAVTGAEGEPMSTCPSGQSCQPMTGACGSNEITTPLLTYMPGQGLDAGALGVLPVGGSDAGAAGDSGPDAVVESGAESGAMDATITDTGAESATDAGLDATLADTGTSTDGMAQSDANDDGSVCTNECTANAMQCAPDGGAVQTCMPSSGCTQWTSSTICGTHQTCTGAGSASACTCVSSACTEAGTTCQDGQTLATCLVDVDSCPYVESTMTCQSPESCSGTSPSATCSLTCTDSCASGQAECVSGSLATCMLGGNGCWSYGTAAACPGVRQSCTGTAGSASCTCNADPVCTSVSNACANSSTVGNCAQDAYLCFYETSTTACSSSTTCVSGSCGGVCGPGQAQCSGTTPQTCGSSGAWVSGTACSGSTPVCLDGGCVCSPGATQCSGSSAVQICESNNQWGAAWTCATGTCSAGACSGSTTGSSNPSCSAGGAGLTTCPAGTGSESCCTSLEVPGGTYYRTYTYGSTSSYADAATVSGFQLDKYLVTVGRFRKFVSAWSGGYYPTAGSGIHTQLNGGSGLNATGGGYETGWDATDWNNTTDIDPTTANLNCQSPYNTWTASAGSQENLPINCVDWYEAYAFCIWDGGFLPSEAEWEYAAAGGSQQLEYPWGSTAPGSSNQYAIYDEYYTGNATYIAPVGYAAAGAGLWGQLDLAGEVYESNLDWYATYVDPCTNCADLSSASYRVFRGCAFNDPASGLLPPRRDDDTPTDRGGRIGFRCARTP